MRTTLRITLAGILLCLLITSCKKKDLPLALGGFDIDLFEQNIRDEMDGNVVGYQYTISRYGEVQREGAGGWAIKPGDEDPAGGGPGVPQDSRKPMHVASVSKLLTAIAFMQCLEDNGLSLDDFAYQYLPESWTHGDCIGNINFRHLLQHRSGIYGVSSDYASLKAKFASGVNCSDIGLDEYDNANFGIFRIIIPWITHPEELGAIQYDDAAMDSATRQLYVEYLEENLFVPAGLTGGGHDRAESLLPTQYYDFGDPAAGPWASDAVFPGIGGYGWFISSYEMNRILAKFLYTETYMTAARRQEMLDLRLGFSSPFLTPDDGPLGGQRIHNKGGDWYTGGTNGRGMTAVAAIFPNQVETSLFVNCRDGNHAQLIVELLNAWSEAWE